MKRNYISCVISLVLAVALCCGIMCFGAVAEPEITEVCGVCAERGMEFLELRPTTTFVKISETLCARRYICNNDHLVFIHDNEGNILDTVNHIAATHPNCTVASICANCDSEFGELGDHVFGPGVIRKVTCFQDGATVYTCTICGYKLELDVVPQMSHWYDLWNPTAAGQHSAPCKRPGCPHVKTTACIDWEFSLTPAGADEPETYSVCPVCGALSDGGCLEQVKDVIATPVTGWVPQGDLVFCHGAMDNGEKIISIAFEFDARLEQYNGTCKFTIPAELVEGYQVMLLDDTGVEIEQEVEINGSHATFAVNFANTAGTRMFTQVRMLHLVPIAE